MKRTCRNISFIPLFVHVPRRGYVRMHQRAKQKGSLPLGSLRSKEGALIVSMMNKLYSMLEYEMCYKK